MARPFNPWLCPPPQPALDIRRLDPAFETAADVRSELQFRVDQLKAEGSPEAKRLAAVLLSCSVIDRCLSPVCPLCMRRFRGWLVEQQLIFWRPYQSITQWTPIPINQTVGGHELYRISPKRFDDTLRHQLLRVGITGPIIGGIDGEYDVDFDIWQPHSHLVGRKNQRHGFKTLQKRYYPKDDRVYRPLLTQQIDDRPHTLSYCIKQYWQKRIRGKDGRRLKPRRLDPPQHVQWLLWQHRFALTDFLFLYGVQRLGCRLVPII